MVTLYRAPDDAKAAMRALSPQRVSIDGMPISGAEIAREMQHQRAASPEQAWSAAARSLVVRELLLREALTAGVVSSPVQDDEGRQETDTEAAVRTVIEHAVARPIPRALDCRRYYENNRNRFRSPDIYEAAHILLPARPGDDDPLAEARRIADVLLETLATEPSLFGELAAVHSACPSSKTGGNLGQIVRGQTTPAFEEALAKLEPGQITTDPVTTPYGVHIIRLDRRIDGEVLPFEQVRRQIAAYLSEASWRQAVAQYIARLAARARIEGVELPTPADLRVF